MSQLGLGMTAHDDAPQPQRRGGLAALVAGLVVVVLALGLFWVMRGVFASTPDDYPGPGTGSVDVQVQSGDSLSQMGQRLVDAGVVRTEKAFVSAAEANPQSTSIQPGVYRMKREMAAADAVALLLDPSARVSNKVVVPEGTRVEQTLALISKATKIKKADLQAVIEEPAVLGLPAYSGGNAEGFLFPATYDFEPDATAEQTLEAMVRRFDQSAESLDLVARSKKMGRTPYEVLTVASLVQSEGVPADFGKVARVIYNRLDAGMPLQLDATVNYALGTSSLKLTNQDLAVDSPYNTYLHKGLPPTPINSPGDQAIAAALAPDKGDWLYYVTVNPKTGETKFTSSYSEFLKFKAEFEANTP